MSAKSRNRLDDIEISLTPREWGIRVLDNMRQYPTEEDYGKAIMEPAFEECILIKPLLKLKQQAAARCPGQNLDAKAERAELSRKLCLEFQELKIIIWRINELVRRKTGFSSQAVGALSATLSFVQLEGRLDRLASAISTCIRRTDPDRTKFACIVHLLAGFHNENPPTTASMIQGCADALAELLRSLCELEACVTIIQNRYFDGHPVLLRETEDALKQNIQHIMSTIGAFRILFSFRQRGRFRQVQRAIRSIDVDEIKKQARAMATFDVLKDEGIACQDRWEIFRAMTKAEFQAAVSSLGTPRQVLATH